MIHSRFLFTGEQLDPNTGFYYLRARYMNPASGRFTQQDSFAGLSSDPVTLHKYLYASAEPVGHIDPSGNVTLGEAVTTFAVAGIVNASFGAIVRGLDPTVENTWGSVATDFAIGGVTAPVGGLMGRVLAPVLRGLAAPVLRAVARMRNLTLTWGRAAWERALIRMSRVFVRTTRGYPSVQSTLIGRTLKTLFPKVKWEQHHIFIQQSWSRVGSEKQLYDDLVANEGLRRIGNAGLNLMPIPRSLNNWLGRSEVGTQALATFMYSVAVFGPTSLYEMIDAAAGE